MNDKELDDFFRNKSENPDIPYREDDWEKLSVKLDAPPPTLGTNGSDRGNKGWWVGLIALVFIGGVGFGWKYWQYENVNPDSAAIQLSTKLALDGGMVEPQDEGSRSDEIDSQPTIDSSIAKTSLPATSDPPPRPSTVHASTIKNLGDRNANIPEVSVPDLPSWTNIPVAKQRPQIISIESNRQSNQVLPLDVLTDNNGPQTQGSLRDGTIKKAPTYKPKTAKKSLEGSRFSTTLALAPDVSALKIKDIVGLGKGLGLNLEYFILPNVSINAGAMYVFKTYQAGDGYSTGYVPTPSHINGSCWVLDLPLNLRYYVFNQRLSRWYLTAGLSSYLMLKEKYDLEYQSYNYGGRAYDNTLEIKNKNRHYLNIVNLGIGYERVLTNKLSLQVEPYLKLPIEGIGEGDITLKSAGAFVGLKYGW